MIATMLHYYKNNSNVFLEYGPGNYYMEKTVTSLYFTSIVVIMQLMMLILNSCKQISRLAQLTTYSILFPAKIIWLLVVNHDTFNMLFGVNYRGVWELLIVISLLQLIYSSFILSTMQVLKVKQFSFQKNRSD
jgi:hypothetical protein